MFEVLPESSPDLLAIRVSGRLSREDYARLNPWLDEQLVHNPRPAFLIDMRDFQGWDGPGAMLDDARTGIAHWNDLGRMAILGDQPWVAWTVSLFAPLMKAEMRYFGPDQAEDAWRWTRQDVTAAP
ncbi:STAS/SEC14 domain-containing protein [Roseomonas sp. HJA6]|uniref:STAS/SEC14 domain-containing protein n=1 Tax=Roseomonas alba TaxID=2846776 RepID=A0ABS7A995_9PROT|nr:STAS/SEC14 domain-containing protein [Neoroseomonas alba]MBW6397759.1 STAS/SEC14 domain-containing protein [Neoroseomonas alba]